MSAPFFNTRHWCSLISNPGKTSAGDCGGCMASSGIISARADMVFLTAFSSVSLNVRISILAINSTSYCAAYLSCRNWNRIVTKCNFPQVYLLCVFVSIPLIIVICKSFASIKLSCLHFEQQRGKFFNSVSARICILVLFPQTGQCTQVVSLFI